MPRTRRVTSIDPCHDPLRATEQGYARNLFVSTVLRQMKPSTLHSFEDAEIAQEWAHESRCRRCDEDEILQGDHIRRHLRRWLARHDRPAPVAAPASPVRENFKFLADLLALSEDEVAVLQFLFVVARSQRLQAVASSLGEMALPDAIRAIAAASSLTYPRVAAALSPGARLMQAGLVRVDDSPFVLFSKIQASEPLIDVLSLPSLDRGTFLHAFVEAAAPATLSRADFADAAAVETACALVGAAARTRARGVNLLLHGPTGVGKTELARLMGQELGLEVLAVGRSDSAGEPASPSERLSSLRLALQVAPPGQSLLLFDELEDLFRWELNLFTPSRAAPQMSKQWFGALLEENAVPVVWCTNRIEGIDPAFLRRFAYAVELRSPGRQQRARILAKHLGPSCPLAAPDVDAIAQRFDVSPAQLATAVRGARLVAPGGVPDRATIERLLAPVHRAIRGEDATLRPVFEPCGYRLDALTCREDLAALADRVARFTPGAEPGVTLCLYGPPGTGKSEYVRYLAWRSGRPLVHRRVSDLVSCYVGQTERNIAAAFEEARQDGSLLLFDEADSFLRERRAAERSWEVTQVNEFLQQLEAFPGVCACTTNLLRDLDQAALRRFVFKLEFGFLRGEQAAALFASSFPWAVPLPSAAERELRQLGQLAPGDFAAVVRRLRAMDARPSPPELVRMLADEAALKDAGARAIGF